MAAFCRLCNRPTSCLYSDKEIFSLASSINPTITYETWRKLTAVFPKTAKVRNPPWKYKNPVSIRKFLKFFPEGCCNLYTSARSKEEDEKKWCPKLSVWALGFHTWTEGLPDFYLLWHKQVYELVLVHCCSFAKMHHRQQTSECFKASSTGACTTLPSRHRWIPNLAR